MLGTTIGLAAAVTAASTVLAVALAWLTAATDLPGRRFWAFAAGLPLILPSYVAAYVYVSLLSPKGLVQQLLAPLGVERLPSPYGLPGAFVVLTLISYPYVLLTVRGAIQRLDPSLVEAARSLGLTPWQAFHRVTLPHLRPGIVAGALLVALRAARLRRGDDAAGEHLHAHHLQPLPRLPAETAATLALLLVLLTVVILHLEQRTRGRPATNGSPAAPPACAGPRRWAAGGCPRWRSSPLPFSPASACPSPVCSTGSTAALPVSRVSPWRRSRAA